MKRQKQNLATCYVSLERISGIPRLREAEEITNNHRPSIEQETFYLTNNEAFFPELVWGHVGKKLKTTSDIKNCSNSGPFFNKLLQSKRETNIVLPKVFEILSKKYAKSEDHSYKETNLQSIPWNRPAGRPINRMTGIWKCRLVCKSWCKAIDDLFQQQDVGHCLTVNINERIRRNPEFKNCHLLQYAQTVFMTETPVDFIRHFSATQYNEVDKIVTKNPFFGRNLEFIISTPADTHTFRVEYRAGIWELLGKWGGEIWYCKICHLDYEYGNDEMEYYRLFRQALVCMPNLRSLAVFYNMLNENDRTEFPQLEREIGENPLPTLPNLVVLKCFNFPRPLLEHLRSVNNIREENIHVDYDRHAQ